MLEYLSYCFSVFFAYNVAATIAGLVFWLLGLAIGALVAVAANLSK